MYKTHRQVYEELVRIFMRVHKDDWPTEESVRRKANIFAVKNTLKYWRLENETTKPI